MAWTEPVTDRVGGAYMTATDCNRITGNLRYLDSSAALPADVTAEDILTDWMDKVLGVLRGLCLTLGVPVGALDGAWTYSNINQIEALILACKDKVDLLQRQAALTVYAGDGYCGQGDYYVGGF